MEDGFFETVEMRVQKKLTDLASIATKTGGTEEILAKLTKLEVQGWVGGLLMGFVFFFERFKNMIVQKYQDPTLVRNSQKVSTLFQNC